MKIINKNINTFICGNTVFIMSEGSGHASFEQD